MPINFSYGIGKTGKRTGMLFNGGMNDFSVKTLTNYFDLPGSPGNYIAPQKRALTSMSPTIMTDTDSGDVRLVIGAAGGTKIPTSISMVWKERKITLANFDRKVKFKRSHSSIFLVSSFCEWKMKLFFMHSANVGHCTNALVWTKHQRSGRCATNPSSTTTNDIEISIWLNAGMIHIGNSKQS